MTSRQMTNNQMKAMLNNQITTYYRQGFADKALVLNILLNDFHEAEFHMNRLDICYDEYITRKAQGRFE